MANLLYLVHRMPYPPNKGDKVRSYHVLRHLTASHRVFVGTFVDDPDDEDYVSALRGMCDGLHVVRLQPLRARVASLSGLISGQALTLCYYRSASLRRWVTKTLRDEGIAASVVFSSSMAPYATDARVPMLLDFVDVDSSKWSEYATKRTWPLSWLYAREARCLLAYERAAAAIATRSFFATTKEAQHFVDLAPEARGRVEGMYNGVDADYFAPQPGLASPFANDERSIVFTGAMDYWPNVDAVTWFAQHVMPELRSRWPSVRFHIVGRNPAAAVRELAGEAVSVTGSVPDVRPYLQHAAVVVAPLRLARGVQNKILEAMAMCRPVVAAKACAQALEVKLGTELLAATDVASYVRAIDMLLSAPTHAASVGAAARRCVLSRYSWTANLAVLDRHITMVAEGGGSSKDMERAPTLLESIR